MKNKIKRLKNELNETKIRNDKLACKCIEMERKIEELQEGSPADKKKTPYEIWIEYFQITSDHSVYPESWEAWNAAVKLTAEYMFQFMCGSMNIGYDELRRLKKKTLDKLLED